MIESELFEQDRIVVLIHQCCLTCPEQDDLIINGELDEVRNPLRPLHQLEELPVRRL